MPGGVYTRTKEHNRRISEAKLRRRERLGYYHSPETIEKIRSTKTGSKLTEEHKRKISQALKGRRPKNLETIQQSNKGKIPWIKGKKHTEETKRKIGKANSVKGGITPKNRLARNSFDYRNWYKEVFERDDYTCQKCGSRGMELNAHHIENFADYPEVRFDIGNGITFCKDCHKKFHDKYTRFGTTREQTEEFLKEGF